MAIDAAVEIFGIDCGEILSGQEMFGLLPVSWTLS